MRPRTLMSYVLTFLRDLSPSLLSRNAFLAPARVRAGHAAASRCRAKLPTRAKLHLMCGYTGKWNERMIGEDRVDSVEKMQPARQG